MDDFLDYGRQTMDFVNEQHVARLEVGQQRGEVARALQHRSGGLPQVDAHFTRDDVRKRRLPQPGRAEQQHMVEGFVTAPCRLDEDFKLLARLALSDVVRKLLWAQGTLD